MTDLTTKSPDAPGELPPLRVMFVLTFMPVGGAETLLVNLIRRMDRTRFAPEICCLKYLGPLGEELAREVPAFGGLLRHKYDAAVVWRLARLFRKRRVDAVITVGTGGDKMFWVRLGALLARVPVIGSALHSTGHPDHVERVNRWLAPWTDAFIAVAEPHGRYIAEHEGCPADKVFVIPNGVDAERFAPRPEDEGLRAELRLGADDRVAAIVAALRPEKDHALFLRVAAQVRRQVPQAKFLIVGDGPLREGLEAQSRELGIADAVRFLGSRGDVDRLLGVIDVTVLTSKMEANPVSLLEALAAGRPVVAPAVGSIPESVGHERSGLLCPAGNEAAFTEALVRLLSDPTLAERMGRQGREDVVAHHSLEVMVEGYQRMMESIYDRKSQATQPRSVRSQSAGKAPTTTASEHKLAAR